MLSRQLPRSLMLISDAMRFERAREVQTRELAVPVGAAYLGLAAFREGIPKGIDAEVHFHRDRDPMGEDASAGPVDDGAQVGPAGGRSTRSCGNPFRIARP